MPNVSYKPIPNLSDLQQFDVNQRGQFEGIRQTFYDYQTYLQAGQLSMKFFQQPVGQASKTLSDTNMRSAGQLPQPQSFLCESVEIHLFPGVAIGQTAAAAAAPEFSNDMYDVFKAGHVKFFIGSKDYLVEAPLGRFPPKTKMTVNGALAVDVVEATAEAQITIDYASWVGRPYYLNPPVLLVPNQNFDVSFTFDALVPLSAAARVGVILDGILYRLSQ